jgi:adenine-specific DNA methylase
VLIQKCTLEYPQKYGHQNNGAGQNEDWGGLSDGSGKNPLLEDVKKWGAWILEEAKKEIGRFYPEEADGSIPVGYIWARTIPCQNPGCGAEIPLMRQFWLAKKDKKKVALYPYVADGAVRFRIVGDGYEEIPAGFDPNNGTVAKAVATCPVCGSVVDAKTTRRMFQEGKAGQQMIAVVLHHPNKRGKMYRVAAEEDVRIFAEAVGYLEEKRGRLMHEWGMDPVPDELIHTPDGKEYRPGNLLYNFTPVVLYGMTKWGDLFNPRQKLALITFAEKVRQAHAMMLEEGAEAEYAKAVVSYLGIGIDRLADYDSILSRWVSHGEFVGNTFTRQALPMIWDYFELNPMSHATGDWNSASGWILGVAEHTSETSNTPATITQSSATSLPHPDNFFDAVFTDPPYYDNVPYADLSDFFYVWLKRTIGDLYPELFSTPATPKSNEAIAELPLLRGMSKKKASEIVKGIKTKEHFESMLKESFQEIHRVLKPDGIATIVYAHKSTEGWETLINSLLDSGLIVTGAWPLHTERRTRLRAKESAALASSIYIVARKMEREPTGFYNEVSEDLKRHLNEKLHRLWEEGIGGADFFIAAIGSAIEIFGRYEKVMDYEGEIVRADRLLSDVRRIATDYAVRQILHNGFSGEQHRCGRGMGQNQRIHQEREGVCQGSWSAGAET